MDGELPAPVPPSADAPAAADSVGPLQTFLADRDAPCPSCGYNLRGTTATACPECGGAVELTIREPHPLAARRALLLLAVLWLISIGAVQAARSGHDVYSTANRAQATTFLTAFGGGGGRGPVTLNRAARAMALAVPTITPPATPDPIVVQPLTRAPSPQATTADDATQPTPAAQLLSRVRASAAPTLTTTGPTTIQLNGGNTVISSPRYTVTFPATLAAAGTSGWSSVSWWQWTRAGLWTIVGLLGLGGLLLLMLFRRRVPSRRVVRAIHVLAWTGFILTACIEVNALILDVL